MMAVALGRPIHIIEFLRKPFALLKMLTERNPLRYLPFTPPHGMYEAPATDPARKLYENHPGEKILKFLKSAKNYAAMV